MSAAAVAVRQKHAAAMHRENVGRAGVGLRVAPADPALAAATLAPPGRLLRSHQAIAAATVAAAAAAAVQAAWDTAAAKKADIDRTDLVKKLREKKEEEEDDSDFDDGAAAGGGAGGSGGAGSVGVASAAGATAASGGLGSPPVLRFDIARASSPATAVAACGGVRLTRGGGMLCTLPVAAAAAAAAGPASPLAADSDLQGMALRLQLMLPPPQHRASANEALVVTVVGELVVAMHAGCSPEEQAWALAWWKRIAAARLEDEGTPGRLRRLKETLPDIDYLDTDTLARIKGVAPSIHALLGFKHLGEYGEVMTARQAVVLISQTMSRYNGTGAQLAPGEHGKAQRHLTRVIFYVAR
jgi:hypothetical protein